MSHQRSPTNGGTIVPRRLRLLAVAFLLAAAPILAQTDTLVRIMVPERTTVADRLDLTGSVTAERDASLSPRVSGLVDEILVDAGDRVESGDSLIRLDDTLARLALERAEASLNEGRTQLAESERLREEAETLSADGNIPETLRRTREAEADLALSALARLEAARREQAEIVTRHAIVAPFAGIVSRRHVDPGEWVETGTAVLELVATDRLRLDVQIPQRYLAAFEGEVQTVVRLDALPELEFDARVAARVPVANPDARTFLVRVVIDEPPPLITPGLSARVEFELSSGADALVIERDAVRRYPDGTTTVWVVETDNDGDIAVEVPVTLGAMLGERIIVHDGLKPQARVVMRGGEGLSPGQRVRVLTDDRRPADGL